VHAEVLPWTVCLSTLVLIAQAVFLLERGQTDTQTQLNALPHTSGYTASIANNNNKLWQNVYVTAQTKNWYAAFIQ